MIHSNRQSNNNGLAEDNCRIDQIVEGFLDNIQLDGNRSCGKEAAKFAEMILLNELIFGSPPHTIQQLVETRALHKFRQRKSG